MRNNAGNTRGTPFKKGNAGRPRGDRNKPTLTVEALLDGQAEALVQKAVELALVDDMEVLKLCLDRVCPPRKSRFDLPKVEMAADLTAAQGTIIAAMARADIAPDEASTIAGVQEAKRRSIETCNLESPLATLEKMKA
jgi:hypothetical protein